MNRKKQHASIMLLLIMFTNLSGCLSLSDENNKDDSQANYSETSTLSPQCIEFEQIERCWLLLVRRGVEAARGAS